MTYEPATAGWRGVAQDPDRHVRLRGHLDEMADLARHADRARHRAAERVLVDEHVEGRWVATAENALTVEADRDPLVDLVGGYTPRHHDGVRVLCGLQKAGDEGHVHGGDLGRLGLEGTQCGELAG